jgi:hypothetical protein
MQTVLSRRVLGAFKYTLGTLRFTEYYHSAQ